MTKRIRLTKANLLDSLKKLIELKPTSCKGGCVFCAFCEGPAVFKSVDDYTFTHEESCPYGQAVKLVESAG